MRKTISIAGVIIPLGLVLRAQDFKVEEKEEIRKTLKSAGLSGSRTLKRKLEF